MHFQFDPAKAAGNLRKYGVSFADAEGIFYDPLAVHQQDHDRKAEELFVAGGMCSSCRVMVFVYRFRGTNVRQHFAHRAPPRQGQAQQS